MFLKSYYQKPNEKFRLDDSVLDSFRAQSFPEQNSFSSFFFLCDIEGHIEDKKIKNSLEELGLHCEDMHVLGVFISDKFRQK